MGLPQKGLVVGDPDRARQILELADERAEAVGGHLPIYTIKHEGSELFLAVHGIGMGSASFQISRIVELGGRAIVRLGTAGALDEGLKVGDLLIPSSVSYSGLLPGVRVALSLSPDPILANLIKANAEREGLGVAVGPIVSTNSFYAGNEVAKEARRLRIRGVEMECATILYLSQIFGVRAACSAIISNNVFVPSQLLTAEELKGYVSRATRAVLRALAELPT